MAVSFKIDPLKFLPSPLKIAFLRGIIFRLPIKSEITAVKKNSTIDNWNRLHSTNMQILATIERPVFEIYMHKVT